MHSQVGVRSPTFGLGPDLQDVRLASDIRAWLILTTRTPPSAPNLAVLGSAALADRAKGC